MTSIPLRPYPLDRPDPPAAVRARVERAWAGVELFGAGGARVQGALPADLFQHGAVASRGEKACSVR